MDKSTLNLKNILEALLMSATKPLSLEKMISVFEDWEKPTPHDVREALAELALQYETHAIELTETVSGYRLQTRKYYSAWVSRLLSEKPARYSRAFLETLAIIAYKQPVTRAEIEDIRGVTVNSAILKSLLELEWIKVVGQREVPGKPSLYATTHLFLDYFNLKNIRDLPLLGTIK